jgi:molybdopterin converting factor small subunit
LQSVKFSVAVNKQLAHAQSTLQNGSEIALLPPFSGG